MNQQRDLTDNTPGAPKAPYVAPQIEWEEVLEEAGVYAACVKDEFGSPTPACISAPMAPSGS
jgi:hypothetical protein